MKNVFNNAAFEVKRTRTVTGCLTCRRRHYKCDETKPICRRCAAKKIYCAGIYYQDASSLKGNGPRRINSDNSNNELNQLIQPSTRTLMPHAWAVVEACEWSKYQFPNRDIFPKEENTKLEMKVLSADKTSISSYLPCIVPRTPS